METAKEILEAMPLYYQIQKYKERTMHQTNQQKPSQILNATIVTGQYTDNQGQNKKSYLTIGTLFIYQDGGMSLKLDAMPTNGQNINFYPRKAKEQNQAQQNNRNKNNQNSNYNPNGQQQNQQQYQGY
jgi:hypothetical protein